MAYEQSLYKLQELYPTWDSVPTRLHEKDVQYFRSLLEGDIPETKSNQKMVNEIFQSLYIPYARYDELPFKTQLAFLKDLFAVEHESKRKPRSYQQRLLLGMMDKCLSDPNYYQTIVDVARDVGIKIPANAPLNVVCAVIQAFAIGAVTVDEANALWKT